MKTKIAILIMATASFALDMLREPTIHVIWLWQTAYRIATEEFERMDKKLELDEWLRQ